MTPDGQTVVIPYNQSREFFYPKAEETNCDPMACDKNKRRVTCAPVGTSSSQIRTDKGEVGGTWANSCTVIPCGCRIPWGGTIEHGKKFRAFRAEKATCVQKLLCDDFKEVTCSNGQLSNYDALNYKSPTCAPPICECSHPELKVEVGKTGKFYQKKDLIVGETCEQFSQVFTCLEGGVWQEPGIGNYPFSQCTDPKKDDGEMGGTGGGGGNDEGPGWGIKKRLGLDDSSGSGGPSFGLCISTKTCYPLSLDVSVPGLNRQSCVLPWGRGEAEFYTEIAAFETQCVVKPDKCSNHRITRMCHIMKWTGDEKYRYPSCEEKKVCP
jgi:hypothetical protein